ncbi:Maf family protein [Roseinatronobacter bogoriensis]|uniref:dTTP/UTP pyrophosphatase n=1 Tax=Roseinatronobacter bogoriensis subsp. barguzinensis TaxID=441209 RepID=A0A2K8KF88_9RHOB|nr:MULTISPECIES: nucleoside triphosphate pyrophosphatase [Rhodobaca]ATX66425.1 septum formation protein Maf [Rhodobaca barguzinensis]MBB4207568.1 septum formation protein [Rhodobaca bogoriensis DSM 18756]TDW40125.1 septum formation protein [Rhodobaca barguzinensis]TDY70723.1 septum formation protein [Rhodobaca bogoriensis DSM 18756]
MRLILGSGSPRRKEILAGLGIIPDAVIAADIDETPQKGELPRPYCERVTRAKLDAIASDPDDIVLVADTTVALGRRILGKPENAAQAAEYLLKLSGRRHNVITALAVRRGAQHWARTQVTAVKMKRLSDVELNDYLASGEWQGKAGGYAIQGRGGAFIPWIQGSFTGVMGLPAMETAQILRAAGLRWDT